MLQFESVKNVPQCNAGHGYAPIGRKVLPKPKDEMSIPKSATFEELVMNIRSELEDKGLTDLDDSEVSRITKMMELYISEKEDWKKYALFLPGRYTRNLVDDGNGKYNLLILCWGPGQKSAIHDHAGSHCIMKVLEGELTESLFDWPKSDIVNAHMVARKQTVLKSNQAVYIHDNIGLHRISNTSQEKSAVSVHLYTPPFDICQTFDEENGEKRTTCRVLFHSIRGVPNQSLSSSWSQIPPCDCTSKNSEIADIAKETEEPGNITDPNKKWS